VLTKNPYEDDQGNEEEEFELERYMECAEWDVGNNRKLEDGGNNVQFFIGPYCADQGGKIFLGVFTDEYCTNFFVDEENGYYSDTDFYTEVTGKTLPYSAESIVGMDCFDCSELEAADGNNNNNNNGNQAEPNQFCEEVYQSAGKCESNLGDDGPYYPNENACTYIGGIEIVRSDGVMVFRGGSYSQTAMAFLGILGIAFLLLSFYVCYLKTKLDRARVNLSMQ